MSDPQPREPDLGPHPNVNREPLRTGNPPETQADREKVIFRPPEWVVDRLSATGLMFVIIALLVGVGGFVAWFLLDFRFWLLD